MVGRERGKERKDGENARCEDVTKTLLHTGAFTHRRSCAETFIHTDAFTYTDAFTHRRFYTHTHTCSETSLRITDVECISRAKNMSVKPDRID